jgi:hypothetical protein
VRLIAPDTVSIAGAAAHAAVFGFVAPSAGVMLTPMAAALVRNCRLFMFIGSADVVDAFRLLYTDNKYLALPVACSVSAS